MQLLSDIVLHPLTSDPRQSSMKESAWCLGCVPWLFCESIAGEYDLYVSELCRYFIVQNNSIEMMRPKSWKVFPNWNSLFNIIYNWLCPLTWKKPMVRPMVPTTCNRWTTQAWTFSAHPRSHQIVGSRDLERMALNLYGPSNVNNHNVISLSAIGRWLLESSARSLDFTLIEYLPATGLGHPVLSRPSVNLKPVLVRRHSAAVELEE